MTGATQRPGPGARLAGRYELIELRGSGGMAEVWSGRDHQLHRDVAIKLLHEHLRSDRASVDRFRREAQSSARLVHPNIVAVYDTITEPSADAIVMELVDGPTLREYLDRHGPLEEAEARRLGVQLASALQCAHSHGVVHRDIKPANILIAADASPRLLDFGIAKAHEDPDLTVAGTMVGTATYLAPEQVGTGSVDQRTDLYALSTVLYEAVSGAPPFRGDSPTATALARLHQTPTDLTELASDLSSQLCATIMRNLQIAPERRFQSAHDFGAALADAAPPPVDADRPMHVAHGHTAADPALASGAAGRSATPRRQRRQARQDSASPTAKRATRPKRSVVGRLTLAVLILAPLGVIAALLVTDREPTSIPRPVVKLTPVIIQSATPYDPFGSGTPGENNAAAPRAIDDDPESAWRTESYDLQTFGTKPGVGLVLDLGGTHDLDHLEITSSPGWKGSVFVDDTDLSAGPEPPTDGRPIEITDARSSIDLRGERGSSILVWITDLGPSSSRHRVDIADVTVVARSTRG